MATGGSEAAVEDPVAATGDRHVMTADGGAKPPRRLDDGTAVVEPGRAHHLHRCWRWSSARSSSRSHSC